MFDTAKPEVFTERMDWKANILTTDVEITELLRETKRIAVLGIKPESHAGQPAFYVPKYMQAAGCEIIPVPVYYPEITEILGEKVYRRLSEIPGDIDMINVFRRSKDVFQHVDAIIERKPKSVWLQLGIRDDDSAERMAKAGIKVVQDLCLMVEHRALIR
jgi:predicted CoA-binding protein